MKAVALCFVLYSMLISGAVAQNPNLQLQPSNPSILNLDKDSWKKWLERLPNTKDLRVNNYTSSLWTGDRKPACGTMRTYRVEREAPDSDAVRLSGYSTCVPMSKFRVEDAVAPVADPDPAE